MRHFFLFSSAALLVAVSLTGCKETEVSVQEVESNPAVTDATEVSFANTKCPIMGGKPTADLTAEYNGETIGFCCEGCPEKWAELSAEDQAEKFAKVSVAAAGEHAEHSDHGDHSDHGGHDSDEGHAEHGEHEGHGDHDAEADSPSADASHPQE